MVHGQRCRRDAVRHQLIGCVEMSSYTSMWACGKLRAQASVAMHPAMIDLQQDASEQCVKQDTVASNV